MLVKPQGPGREVTWATPLTPCGPGQPVPLWTHVLGLAAPGRTQNAVPTRLPMSFDIVGRGAGAGGPCSLPPHSSSPRFTARRPKSLWPLQSRLGDEACSPLDTQQPSRLHSAHGRPCGRLTRRRRPPGPRPAPGLCPSSAFLPPGRAQPGQLPRCLCSATEGAGAPARGSRGGGPGSKQREAGQREKNGRRQRSRHLSEQADGAAGGAGCSEPAPGKPVRLAAPAPLCASVSTSLKWGHSLHMSRGHSELVRWGRGFSARPGTGKTWGCPRCLDEGWGPASRAEVQAQGGSEGLTLATRGGPRGSRPSRSMRLCSIPGPSHRPAPLGLGCISSGLTHRPGSQDPQDCTLFACTPRAQGPAPPGPACPSAGASEGGPARQRPCVGPAGGRGLGETGPSVHGRAWRRGSRS